MRKKRWIKNPIIKSGYQLQIESQKCGLVLDSKGGDKLDKSLLELNFYSILN